MDTRGTVNYVLSAHDVLSAHPSSLSQSYIGGYLSTYSRRHKKVPVPFPCNVRTLTVAFTLAKRSVPSVLRTVGTVPSYASLRTVPFQSSVKARVKNSARDSAKFCEPIFEREERSKLHVSSFEREFLRAIDFLRK